MQKKIVHSLLLTALTVSAAIGQQAKMPLEKPANQTPISADQLKIQRPAKPLLPPAESVFPTQKTPFKTLPILQKPGQPHLEILRDDDGQPTFIFGKMTASQPGISIEKRAFDYLENLRPNLLVNDPSAEFSIQKIQTDEQGKTHVRFQQIFGGLPVDGGELIAHAAADGIFEAINTRHFLTPKLTDLQPAISKNEALELAKKTVGKIKMLSPDELKLTGGSQSKSELVIFHDENRQPVLAWKIGLFADVLHKFDLMVDAKNGRILKKQNATCSIDGGRICSKMAHGFHGLDTDLSEKSVSNPSNLCTISPPFADGPTTSNGTDLLGINRTFPTYEKAGKQHLIDAAEVMFNATAQSQSSFPNEPVSVIWGLDAKNTSPQNSNFTYVGLSNNGLSWTGTNNPKAVSAHWNSIQSYKYFQTKHNRNAIDGKGGNVISLINVADDNGASMGNAFWNGEAMFYGNGDSFFKPLARGLDVGGHELTHGVIQSTANLEYEGESGAMNESFADIFGVLIEGKSTWQVGEDVMQSGVFPSGALRDLSNPNNGGTSLNDPWWQPKHVNEKYNGADDNGGVHINSGIPNFAFFKFANAAAVGKDNAGKIFYKALDAYLLKNSKFKDLRVAVLQSCQDLFPNNTAIQAAAALAFDQVGITGPATAPGTGGGNPPPGGNYQVDLQANPGQEFMLVTTEDSENLDLLKADGTFVFTDYLYSDGVSSRPSVTDDGSQILFVNGKNEVILVEINWQGTPSHTSTVISDDPIWRAVAISKNGALIAATTKTIDNSVLIFGPTGNSKSFILYNPTTSNDPVNTDEVQYADVLEFDHSGESLVYDAYNEVDDGAGNKISWWDIGQMDVWKNSTQNFGDGTVQKLFSALPENTGIANPTFSKNSPYIISFDYFDEFNNENYVVGMNTQTGDNEAIHQNTRLGWPTYSRLDNKIAFESGATGVNEIFTKAVDATKIKGTGLPVAFFSEHIWPVYFANGTRSLVISTGEAVAGTELLEAFPNPVSDELTVLFSSKKSESSARLDVFNALGQVVFSQNLSLAAGENRLPISFKNLPAGAFILRIQADGRLATVRVLKP